MAGFDNGTMQSGIFAQTKLYGSILRGTGEPAPAAGIVGDIYIDTQTWLLYEKRIPNSNLPNPWGNYLFPLPATYQATLKWFGASAPTADIGVNGDYFLLWGGYPNYGMQPSIYGPKAAGAWPANPVAVAVNVNPLYSASNEHNV